MICSVYCAKPNTSRLIIFREFGFIKVKEKTKVPTIKRETLSSSPIYQARKAFQAVWLLPSEHGKVLSSGRSTNFRRGSEVDNNVSQLHCWASNENYHLQFHFNVLTVISQILYARRWEKETSWLHRASIISTLYCPTNAHKL